MTSLEQLCRERRCGKRIVGLYGEPTFCSRPKGHPLPHTVNDGIYSEAEWRRVSGEILTLNPDLCSFVPVEKP